MNRQTLAAIAVSLLLGACYSNGSAESNQTGAGEVDVSSPRGLALQAVVERSGANLQDLVVIEETAVRFPDSSLGCPQPGMSYMQVITPGHKVVVKYADQLFDVRVAGQRAIICAEAVSE